MRTDDGAAGDQSRCVCQTDLSLIPLEGESRVARNHREQEEIRSTLLVLMRPRIDQ